MEILIGVVAVIAVALLLVFLWRFGFQKPDPTRAKIPDHMKTSVAWKQAEQEEEERRRSAGGH